MAIKGYTSSDDIASYLQVTITSGTIPSLSDVDSWIEWAESEIDNYTGYSFTTESASSVIIAGTGHKEFWLPREYLPLVSISSMEVNTQGDFDTSWSSKTEGTDFLIQDLDTGKFRFSSDTSGFGIKDQQLKISFIYGYDTTPFIVKELATKLASKNYVGSALGKTSSSGNDSIRVGPITLKSGSTETVRFLQGLNADIENLFKKLGIQNTYIY